MKTVKVENKSFKISGIKRKKRRELKEKHGINILAGAGTAEEVEGMLDALEDLIPAADRKKLDELTLQGEIELMREIMTYTRGEAEAKK